MTFNFDAADWFFAVMLSIIFGLGLFMVVIGLNQFYFISSGCLKRPIPQVFVMPDGREVIGEGQKVWFCPDETGKLIQRNR